jgi:putative membrane protein
MKRFLIELLLTALAILLAANLLPGVYVSGFGSALLAALLLAVVNATIGLILRIITFPLNFLTLGLVSFIISVCMVLLVSSLLDGFKVNGFFAAAIFAIVLSLLKMLFHAILGKR